jgi:N-acetylglutamate synthase-like GNAT family acetyltransferase
VASRPKAADPHDPTNCLWVNQIGNRIVGVVRLAAAGPDTARIVTFRVDPEWYHTAVVKDLIQAMTDHCRRHGCSRILVDFRVAPPWMASVLRRHGFRVQWGRRTWEAFLDGVSHDAGPAFPEL